MNLKCTWTPENENKVVAVLHVTWDGYSTFTVMDDGTMIKGTYNNDKTIVWIHDDGNRTTWIKDGKNFILLYIDMII